MSPTKSAPDSVSSGFPFEPVFGSFCSGDTALSCWLCWIAASTDSWREEDAGWEPGSRFTSRFSNSPGSPTPGNAARLLVTIWPVTNFANESNASSCFSGGGCVFDDVRVLGATLYAAHDLSRHGVLLMRTLSAWSVTLDATGRSASDSASPQAGTNTDALDGYTAGPRSPA